MALVTSGKIPPSIFRPSKEDISKYPNTCPHLHQENNQRKREKEKKKKLTTRLRRNRRTRIAMISIREVIKRSKVNRKDAHSRTTNGHGRHDPVHR